MSTVQGFLIESHNSPETADKRRYETGERRKKEEVSDLSQGNESALELPAIEEEKKVTFS